jgi:hypothetical protein
LFELEFAGHRYLSVTEVTDIDRTLTPHDVLDLFEPHLRDAAATQSTDGMLATTNCL